MLGEGETHLVRMGHIITNNPTTSGAPTPCNPLPSCSGDTSANSPMTTPRIIAITIKRERRRSSQLKPSQTVRAICQFDFGNVGSEGAGAVTGLHSTASLLLTSSWAVFPLGCVSSGDEEDAAGAGCMGEDAMLARYVALRWLLAWCSGMKAQAVVRAVVVGTEFAFRLLSAMWSLLIKLRCGKGIFWKTWSAVDGDKVMMVLAGLLVRRASATQLPIREASRHYSSLRCATFANSSSSQEFGSRDWSYRRSCQMRHVRLNCKFTAHPLSGQLQNPDVGTSESCPLKTSH